MLFTYKQVYYVLLFWTAVTSWRKMNPEIPAMSSVMKTRHRNTAYCREETGPVRLLDYRWCSSKTGAKQR